MSSVHENLLILRAIAQIVTDELSAYCPPISAENDYVRIWKSDVRHNAICIQDKNTNITYRIYTNKLKIRQIGSISEQCYTIWSISSHSNTCHYTTSLVYVLIECVSRLLIYAKITSRYE